MRQYGYTKSPQDYQRRRRTASDISQSWNIEDFEGKLLHLFYVKTGYRMTNILSRIRTQATTIFTNSCHWPVVELCWWRDQITSFCLWVKFELSFNYLLTACMHWSLGCVVVCYDLFLYSFRKLVVFSLEGATSLFSIINSLIDWFMCSVFIIRLVISCKQMFSFHVCCYTHATFSRSISNSSGTDGLIQTSNQPGKRRQNQIERNRSKQVK